MSAKDINATMTEVDSIVRLATSPPEVLARFEEGKSADPTENMSEEDAAKWKAMNEEHRDKFKTAVKSFFRKVKSAKTAGEELDAMFADLEDQGRLADGCPDNLDESECQEWEANTEKYKDVVKDQHQASDIDADLAHVEKLALTKCKVCHQPITDDDRRWVGKNTDICRECKMDQKGGGDKVVEDAKGKKQAVRIPKGNFALVKAQGMDDWVLSVHQTKEQAEVAMRKKGGEPDSMFQNGMRIVDVGPVGKWGIIEIFGKLTVRPKGRMASKTASDVGKIILEQMGGANRLMRMLGVKQFVMRPNGVSFTFPNRERSKGNGVRITLDPDDTYTVEFLNASAAGAKVVKKLEGVYAEDLVDIFERQTGWYLRMASIDQDLASVEKLAAFKSTTPEGAKKMFEDYKSKHPGTKKTEKDFLEGKGDSKPKAEKKDEGGESKSVVPHKDLANLLGQWHESGSDPLYAVSSNAQAGKPISSEVAGKAISKLETMIDYAKDYGISDKDKKQLGKAKSLLEKSLGKKAALPADVRGPFNYGKAPRKDGGNWKMIDDEKGKRWMWDDGETFFHITEVPGPGVPLYRLGALLQGEPYNGAAMKFKQVDKSLERQMIRAGILYKSIQQFKAGDLVGLDLTREWVATSWAKI